MDDNFLLKVNTFYIKVVKSKFIVGQFQTTEKNEVGHDDMLSAVRDVHSRLILGFYDSGKIMPLKDALEESDNKILSEIGSAVTKYMAMDNLHISVGDMKIKK